MPAINRKQRTSFDPNDTYTAYVCYDNVSRVEYSFWREPSGNYWTLRKVSGLDRRPKYYRYVNLQPEDAGLLERKDALENPPEDGMYGPRIV